MAFCTQCGEQLVEDIPHNCSIKAELPTGKVDKQLLIHLLKNPQASLSLSPEKDYTYGLIGMGASLVGFFTWGLALKKQLVSSIAGTVGSVSEGFFGSEIKDTVSDVGNKVPIASNLLLLGLISLVVLLGTLWILGNSKRQHKLGWKEVVTYLGSMQLASGAVFAAAAILAFISLKLSFALIIINLLTSLVLTCFTAQEIYGYPKEQRFAQIGLSMTIYVVIVLLASNLLLKDTLSSLILPY